MDKKFISNQDLQKIISDAKQNMLSLSLPKHISGMPISYREAPTLAMVESVLMHLNQRNLLTNTIEIEYTDNGSQYEGLED